MMQSAGPAESRLCVRITGTITSKCDKSEEKKYKQHYKQLKNDDEFDVFDFDVITAYSRHNNLSDYLVHGKLC